MAENGAAFVTSISVQCVKMTPLKHVTCAIEYCYYTIKINVKTIPSMDGNGKQMKEGDNTS